MFDIVSDARRTSRGWVRAVPQVVFHHDARPVVASVLRRPHECHLVEHLAVSPHQKEPPRAAEVLVLLVYAPEVGGADGVPVELDLLWTRPKSFQKNCASEEIERGREVELGSDSTLLSSRSS